MYLQTHKTLPVIAIPSENKLSLAFLDLNSFYYDVFKLNLKPVYEKLDFDQHSYSSFRHVFFYSGYKPPQIHELTTPFITPSKSLSGSLRKELGWDVEGQLNAWKALWGTFHM